MNKNININLPSIEAFKDISQANLEQIDNQAEIINL